MFALVPSFVAGKIWFNSNDANTTVLESQLSSFDMEVDSDEEENEDEGGLYS